MGDSAAGKVSGLVEAEQGELHLLALFDGDVVLGFEGVEVANESDTELATANILAGDVGLVFKDNPVVLFVDSDGATLGDLGEHI